MPYTVRLNGRTVATFEQRRKLWRGHAPFCETTRTSSQRFSTRRPVNPSRQGPARAHEMISLARSASDPHRRFVANEVTG